MRPSLDDTADLCQAIMNIAVPLAHIIAYAELYPVPPGCERVFAAAQALAEAMKLSHAEVTKRAVAQ